MPRELARILRWRHAGFRRRRSPHVWYVLTRHPRNWLFLVSNPRVALLVYRIRRAVAQDETIIEA